MAFRRRLVTGGQGRAGLLAPRPVGGGSAAHRAVRPFPDTATDGEPHIALAAAVYEDAGDKFIRGSRASARDAYGRAAAAQRAFAGYARSSGEAATRLAEVSRIEGKAQA
jgi:hypothetical protein